MRLNPDCIRDILLAVEDNTGFADYMDYTAKAYNQFPQLKPYSPEVVMYHIKQCEMSGLLAKVIWYCDPGCIIQDLSPAGHEFLANIRSDSNWAKTKDIAGKVGSLSLQVLTKVAAEIVASLIKSHL